LDALVGDQKGERNRRELRNVVDELAEILARCVWFDRHLFSIVLHCIVSFSLRRDGRAALLASKRAIDSQSLSQREELLRSSVLKEKQDLNEKVG
jgi:protein transport protein SEC20